MEQKNIKIVSVEEATCNFKQVLELVEEDGGVVLEENNKPMYVISKLKSKSDEKIMSVASDILQKHKRAFEVLGK